MYDMVIYKYIREHRNCLTWKLADDPHQRCIFILVVFEYYSSSGNPTLFSAYLLSLVSEHQIIVTSRDYVLGKSAWSILRPKVRRRVLIRLRLEQSSAYQK